MAENNSDIIVKLSAIQESLETQSSKLDLLFGEIEKLKEEIKAQSHAESIERILKSAKDLEYRLFKGGF